MCVSVLIVFPFPVVCRFPYFFLAPVCFGVCVSFFRALFPRFRSFFGVWVRGGVMNDDLSSTFAIRFLFVFFARGRPSVPAGPGGSARTNGPALFPFFYVFQRFSFFRLSRFCRRFFRCPVFPGAKMENAIAVFFIKVSDDKKTPFVVWTKCFCIGWRLFRVLKIWFRVGRKIFRGFETCVCL